MPTTTAITNFLPNSPLEWWLSADQQQLPAEVDGSGNVEYKWRLLTGIDEERRAHLVTQMRWRVAEAGHCWYILGVKDKGTLDGLSEQEMEETLHVLEDLVKRGGLVVTARQVYRLPTVQQRVICQVRIEADVERFNCNNSDRFNCNNNNNYYYYYNNSDGQQPRDIKIALLGDSGCGKTTLLSVLTDDSGDNVLDDGRGRMRARLLHHRHELLSGRTSSITQRSLIFSNTQGSCDATIAVPAEQTLLNPQLRRQILTGSRVVHLVDSAGKLRFVDRTTLAVLTSVRRPDGVFLVMEAPQSSQLQLNAHCPPCTLSAQSRELLALVRGLQLPLLGVIVSKIDCSSTETLALLLEELAEAIGRDARLELFTAPPVGHDDDLAATTTTSSSSTNDNACPVLLCSAVTGEYLDTVKAFLSRLHVRLQSKLAAPQYELLAEQADVKAALVVESVAHVPQTGTVVWGQVALGVLPSGAELHVLPSVPSSAPVVVVVTSIERLKIPVKEARPGQYATFALAGAAAASIQRGQLLCLVGSARQPSFRPLKRIIAELTVAPPVDTTCSCSLSGLLFVGGQRFGAQMDLETRPLRRTSVAAVCLVTLKGAVGACVFLQPGAGFVFVETGRGSRQRFVGKVIDYFGR